MIRHRSFHPVNYKFEPVLRIHHLLRYRALLQLHPRSRLINQVHGFIRKKSIRNVTAGVINRGSNGGICVSYGMKLFISLFNTEEDFNSIRLRRRGNLDRLEAPLKRAIALNRLAVLRWSGCANALNLPTGKSGL